MHGFLVRSGSNPGRITLDVHSELARRQTIGCVLFALAAAGCALAPSSVGLIAFRVAQGVAGALVAPASLALIGATYPRDERNAAVAIWASPKGELRYIIISQADPEREYTAEADELRKVSRGR